MPRPRNPNPPNRQACDRCHAQKLRCQHRGGEGACSRCSRSNTACVFSPRQRRVVIGQTNNQDGSTRPSDDASLPNQMTVVDQESQGSSEDVYQDINIASVEMSRPTRNVSPEHIVINPSMRNEEYASHTRPVSDIGTVDETSWTFLNSDTSSPSTLFSDWSSGGSLLDVFSSSFGGGCSSNFDFMGMASGWNQPIQGQQAVSDEMLAQRPRSSQPSNSNVESYLSTTNSPTEPCCQDNTLSSASYVRQLADLNVRLFEHAEILPPVNTVITDRMPSLDGRVFAIDETFRMT